MASNFACESVQRSAGAAPKYLYSPAADGTAPQVGSVVQGTLLNVASGALTSLSTLFPAGTNGVFLVDILGSNPAYSVTSTGVFVDLPGSNVCFGFNNTTYVNSVGPTEIILEPQATGPAFTQTSGGPLNFTINIVKLATVTRS